MAEDAARLVVSLEARVQSFEKALARATGVADKRTRQIEKRFLTANANVSASFAKLGGIVAAGFSLHQFQKLITEAQSVQNALQVAGLSGVELQRVYDQLFASAQRAAVPFEGLATVFGQLSLAQGTLKASTDELVQLTDVVALGLRASGKSASEAQGALLQFEQMLASGTVRAQEFNSVMQNARPILQAAAAGLQEAHGSVAELHHLVLQGKVSSEAFFRAMLAGRAVIDDLANNAVVTLAGRFEQLWNSLVKTAGQFDAVTGVSATVGGAITSVAEGIEDVGEFFERNARRVALAAEVIGDAVSLNFTEARKDMDALIAAMADANLSAVPRDFAAGMKRAASQAAAGVPNIKPVSLTDFAPPVGKGEGGGSRAEKTDLERETERLKKQTALLQAETAARAQLNPLIADYDAKVEKAVMLQRLLTAAQADGVKITPELRRNFETLAGSYATASAEAQKLAETQEQLKANAEEMRELGRNVLGGFVNDLRQGTSAAEALANSLNKVGDKLFDLALDQVFGGRGTKGLLGGTGGGLLGGAIIPGILHDGGVAGRDGYGHGRAVSPSAFAGARRYHNGGIAGLKPDEVPAILQKGEVVIPKIASVGRSGGAAAGGAAPQLVMNATFNVQNGTPEGVDKMQSEVLPKIRQIVDQRVGQLFDRKARFSRSGI